jgi:hypothetical protein
LVHDPFRPGQVLPASFDFATVRRARKGGAPAFDLKTVLADIIHETHH